LPPTVEEAKPAEAAEAAPVEGAPAEGAAAAPAEAGAAGGGGGGAGGKKGGGEGGAVWVVVGLGNPGRRYARELHHVGFRAVGRPAARLGVGAARAVHQALVGEARRGGERVLLVKPQAFMNGAGAAVGSIQRFYRVSPSQLLAVHDDVDLALGRLRLRVGG